MRFKNYLLNEGRSKPIYLKYVKELLLENCQKYLKDYKNDKKPLIYRGIQANDKFLLIDPTKGKPRKSANTKNYYTLIIDNSEEWKNYPKRSKSLICSTSFNGASGYGNTYIVIPYDNAKFGVCPQRDFWFSFENTVNTGLADLNVQIRKTVSYVADIKNFDDDISDLKNALNKTSEILNNEMQKIKSRKDISDKEKQENWFYYINDYHDLRNSVQISRYLLEAFHDSRDINIFEWLKYEILTPEPNGFTTKLTDNSRSREVWIGDAPCILIDIDYSTNFLMDL